MSDLLSELYPVRIDGADFVRLIDVREVLTNPTDEQVNAIIKATERTGKMTASQVRAVLAAAAGGDDAGR